MSLRSRLMRSSLVTLAVGLGALLVVGNVLLEVGARSESSSLLKARADALISVIDVTPTAVRVRGGSNDAGLDRQSWIFQQGRVIERPVGVSAAVDRAALALGARAGVSELEVPRGLRLRAVPLFAAGASRPTGAIVVAISVASVDRLQQAVAVGSLALAALILLAGGLAIRGAVDGALWPVARMTEDAESWSAHDLDGRFALGPPRDELTALAATLDGLLARIAASRRHEQRFAAEMAHELRTPLAAIRGRAELALAERGSDPALEAVVAGASRLNATIDTLLSIARSEFDASEGHVDLAALAREVPGVSLVDPGDLPAAEGDVEVVRRALAPLLDNARRHARGEVTLELSTRDGHVLLAVRDDGPGLDPGLAETAFDPGIRGATSEGAGLGLPLARRMARSCGGDVVALPGPGGAFALRLPAVGSRRADVRVEGSPRAVPGNDEAPAVAGAP